MRLIDLSGQRFGMLVAIARVGTINGSAVWECKCDCGNVRPIRGDCLRYGMTKSCGCAQYDPVRTHGLSRSKEWIGEFRAWNRIKDRCYNQNHKSYHDYGGRGITVCQRWRDDFRNFLADMGKRPSPKHSLDRIKNSGNYEPDNCRWATRKEQANNTRWNRQITWRGRTMTMAQWADELGMGDYIIESRLKRGWTIDEALSHPVWVRRATGRKQDGKGEPSMIRTLALAAVLSLNMLAPDAGAHSWYEAECCSGQDCAPADRVEIVSPEYWAVTSKHGTTYVHASMKRRESKDHQTHICMRPLISDSKEGGKQLMVPLCIYLPGGM